MKTEIISLEALSDILAESEITATTAHAGMLAQEITHPALGRVTTVQGDDGGFLFTT